MGVRIISDSACDIVGNTSEYLKIIALPIIFGTEQYWDCVDMSHFEFYDKLVSSTVHPSTSQAPPYYWEEAIREVQSQGHQAILFTLSSQLSGSYNSARLAASEFEGGVHLIDSENVCIGQKILVEYAVQLAKEGREFEEMIEILEEAKKKIRLIAILDTFKYLRRGGRINHITEFVGETLAIKPIVTLRNGRIELMGQAHGSNQANRVMRHMVEKCGGINHDMPYALGYTGKDPHRVHKFVDYTIDFWNGKEKELSIGTIGGPVGLHTGPGCFGVAFFEK